MIDAQKMTCNYNNIAELPPRLNGDCSPSSSLASIESGGGGQRQRRKEDAAPAGTASGNKRRITLSHCQTVPHLRHSAGKKTSAAAGRSGSLPGMSRIHPTLGGSSSHNRNEEWDCSSVRRDASKIVTPFSFFERRKLRSSIKGPGTSVKKRVTFDEAPASVRHVIAPSNAGDVYYSISDHVQFMESARQCAQKARTMMLYAAMNDHTYKSSIGLTSPQVLGEYLSRPQEIVGIEHLLAGQSGPRLSLRRRQGKDLMAEQRRQREKGLADPELMAEKLGDNSRISSNMARARAAYVAALD